MFNQFFFKFPPSINKLSFSLRNCDISLTQDQTRSVYFLISQNDTSYLHIGSILCLRTTLKWYNMGGYT